MKTAKRKLQVSNDYDFFLFGISCPEKPFRLCYALNHQLRTGFAKTNDVEAHEKNQELPVRFAMFTYRDEEMHTDFRVIVNKADSKVLVPEFRQADYLLMVQGGMPASEKNAILKKVREAAFVQTAFEIDPKKIKSKENFIF